MSSYSFVVKGLQVISRLLRLSPLMTHQRTASRAPSSQGRMASLRSVGLIRNWMYVASSSLLMQELLKVMLLPRMVMAGSKRWDMNSRRTT